MSYETLIDEYIAVWVLFDHLINPGHISPIAIKWREHLVKLQKVIFISSRKIGEVEFIRIVCQGKENNFELEYNTSHHLWKLRKIMPYG